MNLIAKYTLIGLASSIAVGAAFAEGTFQPVNENRGFFIAGSVGNVVGPNTITTNITANNRTATVTSDLYTFGYVGALAELGYNFWEQMGIEGFFAYLGKQDLLTGTPALSGNLNSYAYGADLIGYVPFANGKADLFARAGLGAMYNKVKATATIGTTTISGSNSTTNGMYTYGAGAQYHINEQWAVKASLDRYARWNDNNVGNASFTMATLGGSFFFNV